MKTALVTGGRGQDGSYLIELLLAKGYRVHAQSRQTGAAADDGVTWHHGDMSDASFVESMLAGALPDEIYHLGGFSSPRASWDQPLQVGVQNGLASLQLFELVRTRHPACRLYHASSSEIFGDAASSPQNESTPFAPQNPYAIAKLFAHQMAGHYRRHFGLYVCSGILFNHESPRRPLSFVSQKICHAAACIARGVMTSPQTDELGEPIVRDGVVRVGSLDVMRDFGFAGDYVEAMWLMLQAAQADDYVVGTGRTRSIRELCDVAFRHVGLDWRRHVAVDSRFFRSVDSRHTVADASKAAQHLNWKPRTGFESLIQAMVDARLRALDGAGS